MAQLSVSTFRGGALHAYVVRGGPTRRQIAFRYPTRKPYLC